MEQYERLKIAFLEQLWIPTGNVKMLQPHRLDHRDIWTFKERGQKMVSRFTVRNQIWPPVIFWELNKSSKNIEDKKKKM